MSVERLSISNIEKSEAIDKKAMVRCLFANLPVNPGTNLEILASLIPDGATTDDLQEKINNRYLDLLNLRRSFGQFEPPKISIEMAISILDDQLFEAIKDEAKNEGKILATARHEIGHQLVAANLGWSTEVVTVVPAGYYLGLTVVLPPQSRSFDQLLFESAAISFGGAIAAQMSGDEVGGIGADMASVQAMARVAVACSISSTEESFQSEAARIAHQALKNVGTDSLNRQAQFLTARGTIA